MSQRVAARPEVRAKVALIVTVFVVAALVAFGLRPLLSRDPVGTMPSGVLAALSSHGFIVELDRGVTSQRAEEAQRLLDRYGQGEGEGEVIGVCLARVSHDGEDGALRWVVAIDGVTQQQFGQAGGMDSAGGTLVLFLDSDSHKMWRSLSY